MDSSKILPGSEECSSSESGWTTYIASPDLERDEAENEDDDDEDDEDGSIGHQVFKKQEEADSDDSMASDASSGPSDQRYSYGYLARSPISDGLNYTASPTSFAVEEVSPFFPSTTIAFEGKWSM